VIPAPFVEPPAAPNRTPRAFDLQTWVVDERSKTKCPVKVKELESLALSLGLHIRFGEDLTDEGERTFVVRISRVLAAPDTEPIEEPEPMTDEEFSARCAVQPDMPFARLAEVPDETLDDEAAE
jgi:hypothetical protein